jgi:hypothetical protein
MITKKKRAQRKLFLRDHENTACRPRVPREQQAQPPRQSHRTRGLCRLPSRATAPRGLFRVLSGPATRPAARSPRPAKMSEVLSCGGAGRRSGSRRKGAFRAKGERDGAGANLPVAQPTRSIGVDCATDRSRSVAQRAVRGRFGRRRRRRPEARFDHERSGDMLFRAQGVTSYVIPSGSIVG